MSSYSSFSFAVHLIFKATILAFRWAGVLRVLSLARIAKSQRNENDKEFVFLRDKVAMLEEQVAILKRQLRVRTIKKHYSPSERLSILCFMEYFGLPKRKVANYFCVANSTLYRWLKKIDEAGNSNCRVATNKTPVDIAALVWEIAKSNRYLGRFKISGQLALLGVFLSASTVRNILMGKKPRTSPETNAKPKKEESRSIAAFYPNHVWSVDHTIFSLFGLFPIYVLVAIDHFSRKVVSVIPLEGPNAAWTVDAMEAAFQQFGTPKHIITDQHGSFYSKTFRSFLDNWGVKQRFGAVGKHGSIAVTERVIKTLKYEWLSRVPILKGFGHLSKLCANFSEWYNEYRPHMTLNNATPNSWYQRDIPEPVSRDAKIVPLNIEKRVFKETRITAYRLKQAA